jgi:uncharacterized protein YuzE
MKVQYAPEVDALCLRLVEAEPEGVIEISEGVNLDTAPDGQLVGIEILNASRRLDLGTFLTYSLEMDRVFPPFQTEESVTI